LSPIGQVNRIARLLYFEQASHLFRGFASHVFKDDRQRLVIYSETFISPTSINAG
jgi:hypothetical protein